METDQLLRLRYTHADTHPSVQMRSFSEVEVYIEHLGGSQGSQKFPTAAQRPLSSSASLANSHKWAHSALLVQVPFIFPPRYEQRMQTTSLRACTAHIAPRHHRRGPSETNEESGDELSNRARPYLSLIGHLQTTGLS